MKSERIYKWDWMKLILIFLVVFGHLLDRSPHTGAVSARLDYWIYLFHMPAFIFVSGMFARGHIHRYQYAKIFSLLLDFWVMKLIFFISEYLLNFPKVPSFSLFSESGVPWYLLAMFIFEIVTVALQSFDWRFVLPFLILLSAIAPYDSQFGDEFALARVIAFFPFFYLGYLCDPVQLMARLNHRFIRWGGAFVLLCSLVGAYFLQPRFNSLWDIMISRISYLKMGHLFVQYGPILRMIDQVGVALIIFSLAALMPNLKGFFARLGAKTMQIFVFHIPVIWIVADKLHVDDILYALVKSNILANFIFAILIVVICASQPFSWLTAKLMPRLRRPAIPAARKG